MKGATQRHESLDVSTLALDAEVSLFFKLKTHIAIIAIGTLSKTKLITSLVDYETTKTIKTICEEN